MNHNLYQYNCFSVNIKTGLFGHVIHVTFKRFQRRGPYIPGPGRNYEGMKVNPYKRRRFRGQQHHNRM